MKSQDKFDEEMNEDEIDKIINYINDLDYEKYQQDLEIREALQLFKNKMDKEEREKNQTEESSNSHTNDALMKTTGKDIYQNKDEKEIPLIEEKREIKELTDAEKIYLENNWNSSTNVNDTVKDPEPTKESIQTQKQIEKLYNNEKKKLAVHSYQSFQKLLQRQGINHFKFPIRDALKITVQNDKDKIIKNKHASIPFLLNQPHIC